MSDANKKDDSDAIRPTRYRELGYRKDFPNCWRFYDMVGDGEKPAAVGPQYRTQTELLADLERFASFFGC